jgi:hypothetical protein
MKHLKSFNESIEEEDLNEITRYIEDVLVNLHDEEFDVHVDSDVVDQYDPEDEIPDWLRHSIEFDIQKEGQMGTFTYDKIKDEVSHIISYLKENHFILSRISMKVGEFMYYPETINTQGDSIRRFEIGEYKNTLLSWISFEFEPDPYSYGAE